jgi:VDE lipocalin domain
MQVCSYRVIASYESEKFENFSRCILQKHNCLRNTAEIPMVPSPAAIQSFQGHTMTHALAEDLFIGHLADGHPNSAGFSWRVACGKNAGVILPLLSLRGFCTG